ncbi:hypothetical protein SSS_10532 [Sarcoptes scabiei]|uniref:Uncharacterized protein n=1 Tax=Sarcoptes scabiei TaxID=52283 RepID=A0A834R4F4_SARSC|nr:hypothetical protein SSS_10532 [Sarcoptes scabiei]
MSNNVKKDPIPSTSTQPPSLRMMLLDSNNLFLFAAVNRDPSKRKIKPVESVISTFCSGDFDLEEDDSDYEPEDFKNKGDDIDLDSNDDESDENSESSEDDTGSDSNEDGNAGRRRRG